MNKAILIGRLTKEPEVKMTSNQVAYSNFTVAVDRKFKDANGNRETDFINCVAWRQTASFLGNYFHKGNKIIVEGTIQTRSYDDQNGQKVYVTEVLAEGIEFGESAKPSENNAPVAQNVPVAPPQPAFNTDDVDDVQLPFEV